MYANNVEQDDTFGNWWRTLAKKSLTTGWLRCPSFSCAT